MRYNVVGSEKLVCPNTVQLIRQHIDINRCFMSEEFIVEGTGVAESATKVVIYPYCTKKNSK